MRNLLPRVPPLAARSPTFTGCARLPRRVNVVLDRSHPYVTTGLAGLPVQGTVRIGRRDMDIFATHLYSV
jgi:hypothetical protein